MTTTDTRPTGARRRAVRAAGPASDTAAETTSVRLEKSSEKSTPARKARKAGPPPRRPAHRRLVATVALAVVAVALAGVGTAVTLLYFSNRNAEAAQQRNQQFVDNASQLAVNMYSFNQNTVEDSVNRVVNSTTGPLHDMLSRDNHKEILAGFFRSMGGSAEAVVTGAALEKMDADTGNAIVLVTTRVTTTDMNGNNQPSVASRMRITVHRDDDGRMTGYDLQWPDGGN